MLEIAHLQGDAELLNLVARVVDIELAGHVVAGLVHRRGQAVAQRAAARVAHVHRARRVGPDKLDHHLAALPVVAAAVIRAAGQHVAHHPCEPAVGEEEVDEPRSRHLAAGEAGARELRGLAELRRKRAGIKLDARLFERAAGYSSPGCSPKSPCAVSLGRSPTVNAGSGTAGICPSATGFPSAAIRIRAPHPRPSLQSLPCKTIIPSLF